MSDNDFREGGKEGGRERGKDGGRKGEGNGQGETTTLWFSNSNTPLTVPITRAASR